MILIYPARKAAVHQGWLLQKHLCSLFQQFNSPCPVPVATLILPKEQKFEQLPESYSKFQLFTLLHA